ncbi:hypothetical protein ACNKHR_01525 [Shigella flexneri]
MKSAGICFWQNVRVPMWADPIAQAAMFGYFLMSVFMIITGFALYSERGITLFFAYPLCGGIFLLDGWQLNGHSQLASAGDVTEIGAFVIGHVYMALRERTCPTTR